MPSNGSGPLRAAGFALALRGDVDPDLPPLARAAEVPPARDDAVGRPEPLPRAEEPAAVLAALLPPVGCRGVAVSVEVTDSVPTASGAGRCGDAGGRMPLLGAAMPRDADVSDDAVPPDVRGVVVTRSRGAGTEARRD